MNKFTKGALLLFHISVLFTTKSVSQHLPESKHRLVVIAHRGNHVNFPENTLASYKAAITAGADYVEVDLRTTKDGHLVVLHDSKVDRTTNGLGKISDMTLEEVGEVFGVTRERIRQIEGKGLRKLKHPSRSRLLEQLR